MKNMPLEVRIKDKAYGYDVTYPSPPADEYNGEETRYLRADLTCGECRIPWGFRASDCPRGFVFPTSKNMINEIQKMLDGQPACMAFKVKP